MNHVSDIKRLIASLPPFAAVLLVFLGIGSSTVLGGASSFHLKAAVKSREAQPVRASFDEGMIQVLGKQDAVLYRAAFAAQEKEDWAFADTAISHTKDKRLVGHVLADRYLRRGMTLNEAHQWMRSYATLPEAPAIYAKAKTLDGFSGARMPSPKALPEWQGFSKFGPVLSFRSEGENAEPLPKGHPGPEITTALRRGVPAKARDIMTEAIGRGALPITQAGVFSSQIAAAFFYQGDVENARSTVKSAAKAGIPLGLWIEGLSAWKQRDFGTSANAFSRLAHTAGLPDWNQAAASYWAYRAITRQGDKKDGHRWLTLAAKHPHTFYGAMAADLLGHRRDRSWKMPNLTEEHIALLSSQPSGWQALALVQVGRPDLAEGPLRRAIPSRSRSLQAAALALAEEAKMPALLLELSGVARNARGRHFDAAMYPLPPWEPADGFVVDRALIFAIMHRESQFDPWAVSSSGACGLMQIMPATARHIDGEKDPIKGKDSRCPERLFDPATNIEMAQRYVRILSEMPMIGDNLLLLLAAYNGGPGNLSRWMAGNDRSDPLLFIESMPLRETRDYVQQVMLHYWAYRSRLSGSDTAMTTLARGEWPRYALDARSVPVKHAGIAHKMEIASIE